MTVGELLSKLQKMDPKSEVRIYVPYTTVKKLYSHGDSGFANHWTSFLLNVGLIESETVSFSSSLCLTKGVRRHEELVDKLGLSWEDIVTIHIDFQKE